MRSLTLSVCLLALTSPSAYAVNTGAMRPSSNIEDRRGDSEEGAAGMDLNRNLFQQLGQQAKAKSGIFQCPVMAQRQMAFVIMTNDVAEAPPVRPLVASGKEAQLGMDTAGADACGGAQEKMLELSIVGTMKAQQRKNTFYNGYKQPATMAKELSTQLKKAGTSNDHGCAQVPKLAERLQDYYENYEKVADYLDGNHAQMAKMQGYWSRQVQSAGCTTVSKVAATKGSKGSSISGGRKLSSETKSFGDALYKGR